MKDVHHVGSTSIPGLAAKPIIDIDIVMNSETVFPSIVESLDAMGYNYEGNLGIPGREAFRRRDGFSPYTEPRCEWLEHHLYICSEESEELKRHLLFRNSLLNNPDLVIKYELLKRRLATEHKHNRAAYVDGKTDFVKQVLIDVCE